MSALWVYIRHYGDQRPVSGSVTLHCCKMGHSVATCKYQDSSSVLPSLSVRGDIVAFSSELNTRWKASILPFIKYWLANVPRYLIFYLLRILISQGNQQNVHPCWAATICIPGVDVDSADDTSIVAVTCEGGLMMAPSRADNYNCISGSPCSFSQYYRVTGDYNYVISQH